MVSPWAPFTQAFCSVSAFDVRVLVNVHTVATGVFGIVNDPVSAPAVYDSPPAGVHAKAAVYEPTLAAPSTSVSATVSPENTGTVTELPATGAAGAVDVADPSVEPSMLNAAVSPVAEPTHDFRNVTLADVLVFV